ncbi:threonine-phosphate decarboxylase [Pseudomonas daroniae]|uniref:threonine-phosphate decarboxylase n=1 Tax=Phytopseudomonas daroniae TaxID=2487519 RepID=A0A4Q9QQP0_9GAMM|nr:MULTISPECIES: threonine-phosphate decarboxylase CobD [Pseudomonas]TBU82027.1 threonine-phosphate decarboxylase [Pseudomonas daroniae]TBU84637.1 threonine-phosphate decarboxylase [Pseudomonas sp. FRB 228]TBU92328.1 threonine-phosphate decarboxylase [Pseudomonas daroniae]
MLEHGGRLRRAALQYAIELADWLDVSTGVAPYGLPLPEIPEQAWMRLPELDDGLEAAACAYYGVGRLLPVAGSQAAIQCLPRLRREARVGIVSPAYAEHAAAWQREGHRVLEISEASVNRALERLDVLLLVNPNNPTGRRFSPQQLYAWHARLAARGGWLIVDEAFIDCTPEQSLAAHSHLPGLIVLRSFGKFFGMAGARLGFVLADTRLLAELEEMLGPWTVSGPTRWMATHLLEDRASQQAQRQRLVRDGQRLADLLREHDLPPTGGCALFQWIACERAALLHEFLACNGILTRLFERPASIRFGLPPDEEGWQRLDRALSVFAEESR